MGLLSAYTRASLVSLFAKACDATVQVYRRTSTSGSTGQNSGAYVLSSTVPCLMAKPTGAQLQTYASVIGSSTSLMMHYPQTGDVQAEDRIPWNGKNWTVQYIDKDDSYSFDNIAIITAIGG